MTDDVLITAREGAVEILTMNRPAALNALSTVLRRALATALRRAAEDDAVRAVVLTGAGERAFTAGLDLKELGAEPGALGLGGPEDDPVLALRSMRKPVIAAVNGVAVTGGFELALNCDLRLVSPAARFADTHSRVGLLAGWGLSVILPRLIGPGLAKEISFTGRFMGAEEAVATGLANRLHPADRLVAEAVALAQAMAEAPADWLAATKDVIDRGWAMPLADALLAEAEACRVWNGRQTPEALEARRAGVMAKGRTG